jgi:hypothetical protein
VSLSQITKKLRKEAVGNPKKAGLLGLVFAVAVYFWLPLVRDWTGGPADASPAASTPAAPATPAAATPQAAGDANAATPMPPWEKLVEGINNDSLRAVAQNLLKRPDPFHQQDIVAMQKELARRVAPPKTPPTPMPEPVLDPEKLGMQVTSTIVGPGRRVAMIDGEVYREGDTLSWHVKEGPAIDFHLRRVETKAVTLERDGRQFELRIPERYVVQQRPAGEGK